MQISSALLWENVTLDPPFFRYFCYKERNEKSENRIVCAQAILSGNSKNIGPHRFTGNLLARNVLLLRNPTSFNQRVPMANLWIFN